MGSATQIYTSFLSVVFSIFPIITSDFCQNYLLTGRNISIKESSVYGVGNPRYIYDPYKALLHSQEEIDDQGHIKLASWTAGRNDTKQFWQVSLEAPSIVRGVVTQGKDGCCQQWVQEYRVLRSSDCQHFLPVEWKIRQQIFSGNWDESTPVTNFFRCAIKTKCIRIVPVTWHNRISMRFEILGCPIASAPFYTTASTPVATSSSSTTRGTPSIHDLTTPASTFHSITSTPILDSTRSVPSLKSASTLVSTLQEVTSSPILNPTSSAVILQSTESASILHSTFTSFLDLSTARSNFESTRSFSTEITTTASPMLESTTSALSLESTSSGSSLESATSSSNLELTKPATTLESTIPTLGLASTTSASTLELIMSGPSLESTASFASFDSTTVTPTLESTTPETSVESVTQGSTVETSESYSGFESTTSAPTLDSITPESSLDSVTPVPTLESITSSSSLESITSSSSFESTLSDPDLQSTTSAIAVPFTTSSACLRKTHSDSTLESTTSAQLPETTASEFVTSSSSAFSTRQACDDIPFIDCHMLDSYLGICKDPVTANVYCKRFCGFCDSTTEGATESTTYVPTSSKSMTLHYDHTVASTFSKSPTWPSSTSPASVSPTVSTEHILSTPTFPSSADFTTATPVDLTTSSAWTSMLTDASFSVTEETATSMSLSSSGVTSNTSPFSVSSTTAISSTDNPLCNNNIMSNISCTFDSGPCGFYIPMFPHIWDLVSHEYGDGATAVIHGDHSTGNANGKYAVFEANNIHTRFGSSSEITSSTVPANVSFCLTFWYNMPTNSSACSVYKRYVGLWMADELLWQHSGKETNGWTEASVVMNDSIPFQVVFSSVKTAFDGYFGIDDISFHFVSR